MSSLFSDYHIWTALWATVRLTIYSAIGSLVLGTIVATLRLSPIGILRFVGTSYVNIFRNTPLTLIILSCSFVLYIQLGITLANSSDPKFADVNGFRLAVVGMTVYHATYVCEALRSGFNTIPLGQAEAARSIGLTFGQTMREVILPQAFRGAVVPLGNTLIALTKNTTVAVTIGVYELSAVLKTVTERDPGLLNLSFLVVGVIFVILTLPMGVAIGRLGNRVAVKR
ncbi:amino acid ABC transporter permease [Flexivirga caeni]|uniref:Amino acid ABC transporter permease n=1 Tax=Flexivirga caeni TaxID=2294115 RepID=A0A3M9M5J6_9MICO|nr:amino acid ABC transporter permease [Flexivirga caeni]RNI20487.1 amino acid ABC transporter permease [Flexivirga caeni]